MIEFKNGKAYCDGEVYVVDKDNLCDCCVNCPLYGTCTPVDMDMCADAFGNATLTKEEV